MHKKSMSSDFCHESASKQITWKISFRASKPHRLAGLYDTSLSESLIAAKTAEMHDATIWEIVRTSIDPLFIARPQNHGGKKIMV